jgi:hypothetical protein
MAGTGSIFIQGTDANKLISISAEHATDRVDGPVHAWVDLVDALASAGVAVSGDPNTAVTYASGDANAPRLKYTIRFSEAGTWTFSLRGKAATTGDNSVHWRFNGGSWVTDSSAVNLSTYVWDTQASTVTVAAPGDLELEIQLREDGIVLDKLVLWQGTYNPATVNGGLGPDESAVAGSGFVPAWAINSNQVIG